MDLFRTTREIILDTVIDEYDFCSVPKIALEDNEQKLSVMLMADMKSVDVNTFTRTLGKKNDGFKGLLRLVRSKLFTANDKTRNGQSMNGWRLLELKGDEEFMNSLSKFEANHPFQIWGGRVFIRGGIRKPPDPTGANYQPLGGQRQAQGGGNTEEKEKEERAKRERERNTGQPGATSGAQGAGAGGFGGTWT